MCVCLNHLDGQVVVITGATSGIGKALALELAKRSKILVTPYNTNLKNLISDAILVLACRDVKKGVDTKIEILQQIGLDKAKIHVKYLDLCKFASIIQFVENLKGEFSELYALVNNAGVFYHPQSLTEDGFEITLQTNYLGNQVC